MCVPAHACGGAPSVLRTCIATLSTVLRGAHSCMAHAHPWAHARLVAAHTRAAPPSSVGMAVRSQAHRPRGAPRTKCCHIVRGPEAEPVAHTRDDEENSGLLLRAKLPSELRAGQAGQRGARRHTTLDEQLDKHNVYAQYAQW